VENDKIRVVYRRDSLYQKYNTTHRDKGKKKKLRFSRIHENIVL